MATPHTNRHGRKPGRGLRPWLLIPKYLAVGAYFGGIMAVAVLFFLPDEGHGVDVRMRESAIRIAHWLILPGAVLASVMGMALWLQHAKVFWRMRWFRVKLLLIFGLLGPIEMLGYTLITNLDAWKGQSKTVDVDRLVSAAGLGATLIGLIILAVTIIMLGRLKPRLGQPIGQAPRHRHAEGES